MLPFVVNAKTIADAWFQIIYNIFEHSYRQDVQRGSFEKEQYRLQYPGLAISIEYPWDDMIPVIPAGLGIPAPTTRDYVDEYFERYIMDPLLAENETYKYSSRIHHPMPKGGTQFDRVISMLRETPKTNQAVIEIGSPEDHDVCLGNDGKNDPPCARLLDLKAIPLCQSCDGKQKDRYRCDSCDEKEKLMLTLTVYMRSWDLWAGLPSNLCAFELLKQYVAIETGLKNGPMYAYSAGAHIYGYQEEIARIRAYKTSR